MADRLRVARRGLIGAGLGLVALVVAAWIGLAIADVKARLATAEHNNQILAQQVRDLGGVPKVTPAPGPSGPAGSPGAPGATVTGPPGRNGTNGTSGSPGATVTGPPGSPGATVTGPAGKDGKDGTNGTDGKDSTVPGPQGPAGSPGPACPSGYHLTTETVVTQSGPQQAALCEPDGGTP